jgi:hypothetical protein
VERDDMKAGFRRDVVYNHAWRRVVRGDMVTTRQVKSAVS